MLLWGMQSPRRCHVAQAEDRAHRIGQKRDVLVLVLLSAGTIEAAILDRARRKLDIDAKVIQVGRLAPAL